MNIIEYILIGSLSLFTSIIFITVILYSDRQRREPLHMIMIALISCIFTICLSLLIGQFILPKFDIITSGLFSYKGYNLAKIILLAIVEEYSKLLVLYLFISKNSNFDDIYDGFVYSSLVALSFAALESLIYVFNEPNIESMKSLAVLRGITTVPLHFMCGIAMGYYVGMEKFSWGTKRRTFYLLMALIMPVFLHTIYNFTFTNIVNKLMDNVMLVPMIIIFFMPFYIIAAIYYNKTVNMNEKFIKNEKYKHLMTNEEYKQILNESYQ